MVVVAVMEEGLAPAQAHPPKAPLQLNLPLGPVAWVERVEVHLYPRLGLRTPPTQTQRHSMRLTFGPFTMPSTRASVV